MRPRFLALRGSAFSRDQSSALAPLWNILQERGIQPKGFTVQASISSVIRPEPTPAATNDNWKEDEDFTGLDSEDETMANDSAKVEVVR